jgi:hypothetical protein
MIPMPRLLLIGAATRNAGKTTLSCRVIERFRDRGIVAVKATIHRGEEATGHYSVTRELGDHEDKDTGRLFAAGASAVYWLRADERSIERALVELFALVPPDAPILCESNSLRHFVMPGLFLFVQRRGEAEMKETARAVLPFADRVVASYLSEDELRYDPDIVSRLAFGNGTWRMTE